MLVMCNLELFEVSITSSRNDNNAGDMLAAMVLQLLHV